MSSASDDPPSTSAPGSPHDDAVKMAAGAGLVFSGRAVSVVIKYATQVVLARLLNASGFGIYSLGLGLYQIAHLVPILGLQTGSVRFVSRYRALGEAARLKGALQQSLWLPFIAGSLLAALLVYLAPTIAEDVMGNPSLTPAIRIFGVALPFGAGMMAAAYATTGLKDVRYQVATTDFAQPVLNLGFAVILVGLGFGVTGAAVGWLLSVVASFGIVAVFIRRIWKDFSLQNVRSTWEPTTLLGYSLPLMMSALSWTTILWMDVLFLGYFRPAADVGVYRAASQTALLMTVLLTSLGTIFSPMIAELHEKAEHQRLAALFSTSTLWSFMLTLPLFLLFIVSGDGVLSIFGPEFIAGFGALIILSVAQLINAGSGSLHFMLSMSGHPYKVLAGDAVVLVVNIVLNLLFVPKWGMHGAALATAISIVILNLLRGLQVYGALRMQPYTKRFLQPILAAVPAGLAGLTARTYLMPEASLLNVLVLGAGMAVVYFLCVAIQGLDDQDHLILRRIGQGLRGRGI